MFQCFVHVHDEGLGHGFSHRWAGRKRVRDWCHPDNCITEFIVVLGVGCQPGHVAVVDARVERVACGRRRRCAPVVSTHATNRVCMYGLDFEKILTCQPKVREILKDSFSHSSMWPASVMCTYPYHLPVPQLYRGEIQIPTHRGPHSHEQRIVGPIS